MVLTNNFGGASVEKVLIVQGGWDGHEPVQVSERFKIC